jgi:hypothetical protein
MAPRTRRGQGAPISSTWIVSASPAQESELGPIASA